MKYLPSLVVILLVGFAPAPRTTKPLFIPVEESTLTDEQAKILQGVKEAKETVKTIVVKLQDLPPDNFLIPVPGGEVEVRGYDKGKSKITWGELGLGHPGSGIFLIHSENKISGLFQHTNMKTYSVKSLGGGLHAVVEYDPKK